MFSDILFEQYAAIIESLENGVAYPSVYSEVTVIDLLINMQCLIASSDSILPDGKHIYGGEIVSKDFVMQKSIEKAKKDYVDAIKKSKNVKRAKQGV